MGYYSSIEGHLEVSATEPLKYGRIKTIFNATDTFEYLVDIENVLKRVDIDEPSLTLTMNPDGNGKFYYVEKDSEQLINNLMAEGYTLNGWLIRVGEEQPDMEKYVFVDNVLTVYPSEIVFGDGTKYER